MSQPFAPSIGKTVVINGTTSSRSQDLTPNNHRLHIVNTSDGAVHVVTANVDSGGTLTATTANFPVPAGAQAVIRIRPEHNKVACILEAGSTDAPVYFTPGEGGNA